MKISKLLNIYSVFAITLFIAPIAYAQCPIPPTAIDLSVEVKVDFDKKSQFYTYNYVLKNSSKAKLAINTFILESAQDIPPQQLPNKWRARFFNSHTSSPTGLYWSTVSNSIKPGKFLSGFQIKSKLPPGTIRYYAQSLEGDIPKAITINNDDEASPNCPGFYADVPVLENKVTGFTTGPAPLDQVEVKLKMKVKRNNPQKNEDDEAEDPEISAIEKGKVELLIFGAKDFDLAKVDQNSLRFGPAQAAPLSVKLVTVPQIGKHWRKKPEEKNKLIWAEFNLADLQIRCDLDKALFLRAKAQDNKNILGAVKMKPVICNKKIWKIMGKERNWPASQTEN